MQVGFEAIDDEATEFRCTEAQLLDLMKRAERQGQIRAEPIQLVAEIRAGPLRIEAARYRTKAGDPGNITFTMVYDNDLMGCMGENSAKLFANFVNDTLERSQKQDEADVHAV